MTLDEIVARLEKNCASERAMIWNRMTEFAPIGLVFADRRRSRIIRTLGDAAATLLRDWPSDDGEEYKTVVKACADAISGEIEPAEFRKRLIRVAGEAGITAFSIVH